MRLIIAEKPSVAQEIARIVGANDRGNSYLKGNNNIVSWCYGHLVSLANPSDYDVKYSKWGLDDLPIIPQNYKLHINDETKDHFYLLKNLMNSSDVDGIVCATDSGREGELIFRLVYEKANCKKPFKRLWISSLTDESIKRGLETLKDGSNYDNLYEAGMKRAVADWLVGLNATRFYTVLYGTKITVGRVQTPTLSLIVNREREILNFKKEKNFKIHLIKNDFLAESQIFENQQEVSQILDKIKNKSAICTKSERKETSKVTPKLYDLTTLQRDCNKIFGYTAQETLTLAQALYEKKLLTYPRTDSSYISNDMEEEVCDIIDKIYDKFDVKCEKVCNIQKIINDDKITDHHAIIPTDKIFLFELEKLNQKEKNILMIVISRLLEATYDNAKGYSCIYKFELDGIEFNAKYSYISKKGYLDIKKFFFQTSKEKEEIKDTFNFKQGDYLENFKLKLHEYFTSPPKRYTEDTLLSAMENISKKDYKDCDLVDENIEKKGLGTPATRASIIEKLIKSGFMERNDKNLAPTRTGVYIVDVVDDKIKSSTMTAEWEVKLQKIEKGNYDSKLFLDEIISFTNNFIKNNKTNDDIKKAIEKSMPKREEKEVVGKCPACKNNIYESEKNFYCNNRECNVSFFKEDKFFKDKKAKLTKIKLKKMLEDGKVEFEKLYSEKKNKTYSANVRFEINGKYVNYKLDFN